MMCNYSTTAIKILQEFFFFINLDKLILKFICKGKRTRVATRWVMSIIPATWEAEIGRTAVRGQTLREKIS
jgi:hypothetical protein